jgi:CRP-like cAMP-binding protein
MDRDTSAEDEQVAVVSCDIVGHSTANGVDQVDRVQAINDIVFKVIRRAPPNQVVWSSGGDGGHVVFRGEHWQPDAIRLVWELLSWSREKDVKLRITGHVGGVTSVWGADGRVQLVGPGINFAGWLLRQISREAMIGSEAFKRGVMSAKLDMPVTFHDERLFVDRHLNPQLLYLMSFDGEESRWLDGGRNDQDALKVATGWDVLYYAKRIWQVNSKDKHVAPALERTAGTLRPPRGGQNSFLVSMRHEQLAEFLRIGQLIERRPGEVICRYGDPGESMFVILRGEVGVYNIEGKGYAGDASPKHVHKAGEVVGELASVLDRDDRSADVVALTDVALLAFNYEEIKKSLPSATTHEFDRFVMKRVLEHVTQVAHYLVGSDRTGPLSAVGGTRPRDGVEAAWRDALLALGDHCQLITVDEGPLDLEFSHIARKVDDERGLYVLVSGCLRSPGAVEADLSGADCPVLWINLPNLLAKPMVSYSRETEPIKVLRIGAAGIEQLELQQRRQLRRVLEHAVDYVPGGYEYQVYLCHASVDKDVVREIRDRLEANKIRCWFDEDEILVGQSAATRMEQGLLASRYLLVCVSSHFESAAWAKQEVDSVLHLDVESRGEPKVLVLKLDDHAETAMPLLLRGKKWLEYRRPGDFERLVELLKSSA